MPQQPTGNRWRDPDTGEIANPRNIDLTVYRGKDAKRLKYGPALQDPPEEEAAPPADPLARAAQIEANALARAEAKRSGTAIAPASPPTGAPDVEAPAEDAEELPIVGKGALGPLLHTPAAQEASTPQGPAFDDDYHKVVDRIREHGPRAQRGDAPATAAMNRIAEEEYSRESGPRTPVVKRLAAYGFGRPGG